MSIYHEERGQVLIKATAFHVPWREPMAAAAHHDAAAPCKHTLQEPVFSRSGAVVRNRKGRDPLRDRSRQKDGRRRIPAAEDIEAPRSVET